jgi:hypothetical protein
MPTNLPSPALLETLRYECEKLLVM